MDTVDYRVLSYVAGLEFALNRLRKQTGFLRHRREGNLWKTCTMTRI
jgi:hypothetical protein